MRTRNSFRFDSVRKVRQNEIEYSDSLELSKNSYRIVSYRIESYRIESYRIESNRIVSNRIVSNRIVSYRIESYRIVSNRIFFKNTKKETANQTVEFISNKNKKLKFWNKN
jgi:ribosomal protein L16/L10AE